jgi:hypothetical protein
MALTIEDLEAEVESLAPAKPDIAADSGALEALEAEAASVVAPVEEAPQRTLEDFEAEANSYAPASPDPATESRTIEDLESEASPEPVDPISDSRLATVPRISKPKKEGGFLDSARQFFGGDKVSDQSFSDLITGGSPEAQPESAPPTIDEQVAGGESQAEFQRQLAKRRAEAVRNDPNATAEDRAAAQAGIQGALGVGLASREAASAAAEVESLRATTAISQSFMSGATFGMSDVAYRKLGDYLDIDTTSAQAEGTVEKIATGLAALGGGVFTGGPALRGLTTKLGKGGVVKALGVRAAFSGASSAVRNSSQVINGDKDIQTAIRDIALETAIGAATIIPEVGINAGLRNFIGQVSTEIALDFASDKFITGRFDEQGAKEWWINEIPQIVGSVLFASRDLADKDFSKTQQGQRTAIKRRMTDIKNGVKSRFKKASENDFVDPKQTGFVDEAGNRVDVTLTDDAGNATSVVSDPVEAQAQRDAQEAGRVPDSELAPLKRPDDIPLGVNREPVVDTSLKDLSDDEFDAHRKKVNETIDEVEKRFDDEPGVENDIAFRKKMAAAQDEFESAEIEKYRRDMKGRDEVTLAFELLELRPDISDLHKIKAAIIVEEVKSQGISGAMETELRRFADRSPDHKEILQGRMESVDKALNSRTSEPQDPTQRTLTSTDEGAGIPRQDGLDPARIGAPAEGEPTQGLPPKAVTAEGRVAGPQPLRDPPPRRTPADDDAERATPENLRAEAETQQQAGFIANPVDGVNKLFDKISTFIKGRPERVASRRAKAEIEFKNDATKSRTKRAARSIGRLRKDVVKRGHDDGAVVDDINKVLGETEYEIGGQRWFEDDLARESVDTLKSLASSEGISIPKNATREEVFGAVIKGAKNLRIDVDEFATKYGLSREEKVNLQGKVDMARQGAFEVEQHFRDSGLEQLGGKLGENEFYSRRQYRYHLLGGKFTPTPEAIAEAKTFVENGIGESIGRLEKNATSLNKSSATADIGKFLQDGDRNAINGLSDADRDRAHGLKAAYDALDGTRTSLITGADGGISIGRSAQGIRDAADYFVSDVMKPRSKGEAVTGFGSVQDALLRRDMNRVFRNLRGEIKDPEFRFGVSRETQGRLINQLAVMNDIARFGGMYSNNKQQGDAKGHSVRMSLSQKSTDAVTNTDRKRFGQMAGKYVSPEFAAELGFRHKGDGTKPPTDFRDPVSVGKAILSGTWDAAEKSAGFMRGIAVMRPAAIMRDIGTNIIGFSGMAGDLNATYAKAYSESMKHITNLRPKSFGGNDKQGAEAREFFEMLAEKGIFRRGSSSMTEDVKGLFGQNKIGEKWDTAMAARGIFADAPAKYAGYMSRLGRLRKWYADDVSSGRMTDEDLQGMAVEHVRKVYDNRDAIPESVRRLARNPLVADYITFKFSSTRSALLSFAEAVDDMRNPRIPLADKAARLTQMAASISTTSVAALRKPAAFAGGATWLAETLSALHGKDVGELEQSSEDVEIATRYMGEAFYTFDPMSTFVNDDGNVVRVVWTGSLSPFPAISDMPVGLMQALGNDELEFDVGGNLSMFPSAVKRLTENILEYNDNRVKQVTNEAIDMHQREAQSALIEKTIKDLANDTLGWYGRVGSEAAGRSDDFKKTIERRASETRRSGGVPRVQPKGFGSGEGRPIKDILPSRDFREVVTSGFIPFKVSVYSPEDIQFNAYNKARYQKIKMSDRTTGEQNALRAMTDEDRWEDNKKRLKPMESWAEHSATLLEQANIKDIEATQADLLAKANFSDKEIRHILGDSVNNGSRKATKPKKPQRN